MIYLEDDIKQIKKYLGDNYVEYHLRNCGFMPYLQKTPFSFFGKDCSILYDKEFILEIEMSGKNVPFFNTVYFVYINGTIKIGYATDLIKRMSAYKTHTPFIRVLGLINGNLEIESSIHKQFKHLNINNEFFKPEYELLKFISDIDSGENIFFHLPTTREIERITLNDNGVWLDINQKEIVSSGGLLQ